MNSDSAAGDMATAMVYIKKTISRYFRPLKTTSGQAGMRILRRIRRKPHFQEHSEIAATGQIQEQKERLSSSETIITVTKTITAAGCIVLIPPPFTQDAVPSRPEIGRKPSTPAGRTATASVVPEVTAYTNL